MTELHDLLREKPDGQPTAENLLDEELDERRPKRPGVDYPETTHPNIVPPTEFMALGLYDHEV